MRDLRPGDRLVIRHGRPVLEDEYGSYPLAFNNLRDWAAWWTRQAELNLHINLPDADKKVFAAIFNMESDACPDTSPPSPPKT